MILRRKILATICCVLVIELFLFCFVFYSGRYPVHPLYVNAGAVESLTLWRTHGSTKITEQTITNPDEIERVCKAVTSLKLRTGMGSPNPPDVLGGSSATFRFRLKNGSTWMLLWGEGIGNELTVKRWKKSTSDPQEWKYIIFNEERKSLDALLEQDAPVQSILGTAYGQP